MLCAYSKERTMSTINKKYYSLWYFNCIQLHQTISIFILLVRIYLIKMIRSFFLILCTNSWLPSWIVVILKATQWQFVKNRDPKEKVKHCHVILNHGQMVAIVVVWPWGYFKSWCQLWILSLAINRGIFPF